MKRKIYEKMKDAWTDKEEIDDKWINSVLYINLRNNSPIATGSKYKARAKCEFCDSSHTAS
jgi:hypothetical protein